MADTNEQALRIKTITDNLEKVHDSLKLAVSHITGLVRVGRATCQEIKTYNIWALGLYNLQFGMLQKLRELGEHVPSLPPQPTYFSWKGVQGQQAVMVDCGGGTQSFEGALADVFRGPGDNATYLSLNEVEIVTQDPAALDIAVTQVPLWGDIQERQSVKQQGLGLFWFVVAGISISIAAAVTVSAIMHYLEVSSTNETISERNKLQAAAYESYLKARLECLQLCTGRGGSVDSCTQQCKSIAPPEIGDEPGAKSKWGFLEWAGAITLGALAIWGGYRLYRRKIETGSFLPKLPESWQLPD